MKRIDSLNRTCKNPLCMDYVPPSRIVPLCPCCAYVGKCALYAGTLIGAMVVKIITHFL